MIDDDGFVCFFNDIYTEVLFTFQEVVVNVSNSVITGNSAVSILTSMFNIVEI